MPKRLLLLGLVVLWCVFSALNGPTNARQQAATGSFATETQARDWAAYAAGKAGGDKDVFDRAFMNLARIVRPAYGAESIDQPPLVGFTFSATIYRSSELEMSVIGPVGTFQMVVGEAVRRFQPIDKAPWTSEACVDVVPRQIDSPDIEGIVVRRNGMTVAPTSNRLALTALTTRIGVTRRIHSGSVCFAAPTFAPGAEVIVIAIPVTGTNITRTLEAGALAMVF